MNLEELWGTAPHLQSLTGSGYARPAPALLEGPPGPGVGVAYILPAQGTPPAHSPLGAALHHHCARRVEMTVIQYLAPTGTPGQYLFYHMALDSTLLSSQQEHLRAWITAAHTAAPSGCEPPRAYQDACNT